MAIHLSEGTAQSSTFSNVLERGLRDVCDRYMTELEVQMLLRSPTIDPRDPETAWFLKVLTEHGSGETDHLAVAYAESLRFARECAEECREGNMERFQILSTFVPRAVSYDDAGTSASEMRLWKESYPMWARGAAQVRIDAWRQESAEAAHALVEFFAQHDVIPTMDTNLTGGEYEHLVSFAHSEDHPSAS